MPGLFARCLGACASVLLLTGCTLAFGPALPTAPARYVGAQVGFGAALLAVVLAWTALLPRLYARKR